MRGEAAEPWGRGKLLGIVAAAISAALALIAGLALFTWQLLAGEPGDANTEVVPEVTAASVDGSALPETGSARRQQIAAAQMLTVEDPAAFREGRVTSTVIDPLRVPSGSRTGPVGIATGYPQTAHGAVGQLAAIDTAVIEGMSVPAAHHVYRSWSTGSANPEQWVMTRNVTRFLTAARQSGQVKETGLVVTATPMAGQVKGTDGPGWVLGCVLLEMRASLVEDAKAAYGHCEAMVWKKNRWLIDGTHPVAPAPSTWPGTELAARAGWRPWVEDHRADGSP